MNIIINNLQKSGLLNENWVFLCGDFEHCSKKESCARAIKYKDIEEYHKKYQKDKIYVVNLFYDPIKEITKEECEYFIDKEVNINAE